MKDNNRGEGDSDFLELTASRKGRDSILSGGEVRTQAKTPGQEGDISRECLSRLEKPTLDRCNVTPNPDTARWTLLGFVLNEAVVAQRAVIPRENSPVKFSA